MYKETVDHGGRRIGSPSLSEKQKLRKINEMLTYARLCKMKGIDPKFTCHELED